MGAKTMNKIFKRCVLAASVFVLATGLGAYNSKAHAETHISANDQVSLGGTYDEDVMAFGGEVEVDADIDGDALLVGGVVDFTGSVSGDAMIFGGDLEVSGEVNGKLRVAGGNVEVQAMMTGPALINGGMITLEEEAVSHSDLRVAGGELELNGRANGETVLRGEDIELNGHFAGPVSAIGAHITIGPDAVFTNTVELKSPSKPSVSETASFDIPYTYTKNTHADLDDISMFIQDGDIKTLIEVMMVIVGVLVLISLFIAFLIGLILFGVTPEVPLRATYAIENKTGQSFWIGALVSFIVVPLVFVLSLVLIVGPVFVIAFVIAGKLCAAFALAVIVLKETPTTLMGRIGYMFLGLVGLFVLGLVPIIGWIASFLISVMGIGALSLAIFNAKSFPPVENGRMADPANGGGNGMTDQSLDVHGRPNDL